MGRFLCTEYDGNICELVLAVIVDVRTLGSISIWFICEVYRLLRGHRDLLNFVTSFFCVRVCFKIVKFH